MDPQILLKNRIVLPSLGKSLSTPVVRSSVFVPPVRIASASSFEVTMVTRPLSSLVIAAIRYWSKPLGIGSTKIFFTSLIVMVGLWG